GCQVPGRPAVRPRRRQWSRWGGCCGCGCRSWSGAEAGGALVEEEVDEAGGAADEDGGDDGVEDAALAGLDVLVVLAVRAGGPGRGGGAERAWGDGDAEGPEGVDPAVDHVLAGQGRGVGVEVDLGEEGVHRLLRSEGRGGVVPHDGHE